jgi:hypothetical protein
MTIGDLIRRAIPIGSRVRLQYAGESAYTELIVDDVELSRGGPVAYLHGRVAAETSSGVVVGVMRYWRIEASDPQITIVRDRKDKRVKRHGKANTKKATDPRGSTGSRVDDGG